MSRSVSSVRSSDPWLRRTDKRPLAQRRGLPPSAGKIVSTFFACSGRDWRHNCIASSAFSRNCSAFVMERSHPERPLAKCLLILSGCLVKIAHFTNHLGRCGRNNAFGRRCWEHPGGSVLCCVICSRCWNPYPQQWLASRRIALRHWRTPDAALAGSYFYRSASRI